MCTTSIEAYKFALGLCSDYEEKLRKSEAKQPKRPELKQKAAAKAAQGPSRKVTDIDYEKHEDTVRELELQEKQEAFARKQLEAANRPPNMGCSHDHQKEWAIYEKPFEEKVGAADRFRLEGNEAYNKQNYGLAAVHYRKALLQFDYTIPETEEQEQQVDEVKIKCLLNLAACKCQQEEWDEVLTQCRLALEINPRSVKAYYRTAQAHLARDKYDLAKDALLSAYDIEPKDPAVLELMKKLKQKMATYKSRSKEVFTTMVSKSESADPPGSLEETSQAAGAESPPSGPAEAEPRGQLPQKEVVSEAQQAEEPKQESPRQPVESVSMEETAVESHEEHRKEPENSESPAASCLRQRKAAAVTSSTAIPADEPEEDAAEESVMQLLQSAGGEKVMCWILVAACSLAGISIAGLVVLSQP